MQDAKTNPSNCPATQAKTMTWAEVVSRAKIIDSPSIELHCLRRIERRAQQRADDMPHFEGDKVMAAADAIDFEVINDPHLQRFAAVQILDNALEYPDYRVSLETLDASKPGLYQKLTQLNAVNDQLIAAKEDRKIADCKAYMQSLDAADIKELTQIAENKTVLARVWDASLMSSDAQEHFGVVLAIGDRFALQKTGRETFPLHRLAVLDQLPVMGQDVSIKYDKGVGVVLDQELVRARARTIGAGR